VASNIAFSSTYTSNHRPKPELIVQLLLHLLTTSGIAISAVGASSLVDAKPDQISTYQGMQEGGSLLLLLAVVLLATLNFTTIRNLHATSVNSRQRSTEKAGSLAIGTLVALHLAAVRVIYSVVYAFTHSKSLSPITGTFAVKLCLITLVQLGASLALVAAGVSTRHIQKRSAMRRNMENTELSEGLMK
jgi:hypothetical protein